MSERPVEHRPLAPLPEEDEPQETSQASATVPPNPFAQMADSAQQENHEQPTHTTTTAETQNSVPPPSTIQTSSQTTDEKAQGNMSVIAHLEELRRRIIYSLLAVAIGSGIAYFFLDPLTHQLAQPAGKLYYMQPAEAFFTYIKITLGAGFLVALPFVCWQVWRFFLPALTPRERRNLLLCVPCAVVLFYLGIGFAFAFVLPAAVRFFVGLGNAELAPLFSFSSYIDFVLAFLLPFGFIFELPLVLVILAKLGLVQGAFLAKKQKLVIFLAFVIAAVISPTPDVFSQTMIAVPMILLYEIGYLIVRFGLRK